MTAGPPLSGPLTVRSLLDTAGPEPIDRRAGSATRCTGAGQVRQLVIHATGLSISGERNPPALDRRELPHRGSQRLATLCQFCPGIVSAQRQVIAG